MAIFKKLPSWSAIASVYAISVIFVYGWTIYWFLWKLPSWIYFLTLTEILLIAAYAAVVNFLESLLILCMPLFMSMLFPKEWVVDRFIAVGGLLSMFLGGFLIYFSAISHAVNAFSYSLLTQGLVFLVLSVCLALLVGRIWFIERTVEFITDRLVIFLYISIPISIFSILVILTRNIFG